MQLGWAAFKSIVDQRSLSIQCVEYNDNYWLKGIDGAFEIDCFISTNPSDPDTADFIANYQAHANQSPKGQVITQYELNDKDLKLARMKSTISNVAGIGYCEMSILSPGTFGAENEGRYIAGGYALSDTYDADDYVTIFVEDTDRLIAAAYGGQTDAWMQANTEYVNYPKIKSYTDDELSAGNEGWYFWPLAQGNSLPPVGECEIDPIGYYAFLPAGLYLKITVNRPNLTTGAVRVCLWWAKHS